MKIAVVGSDLVGLVVASCLAEVGYDVSCIVNDEAELAWLKSGDFSSDEPDLTGFLNRNRDKGRLAFYATTKEGVEGANLIFMVRDFGEVQGDTIDYHSMLVVARGLGQALSQDALVVSMSALPVGSAQKIRAAVMDEIEKRGVQAEIDVAVCPEFLREGHAVREFLNPARLIIGMDNITAKKMLQTVFQPLVSDRTQLIYMDTASAELTKFAANGFLATKISYMNEIAALCEQVGADVKAVRAGMGSDRRIGGTFLSAGIGYGGKLFTKGVRSLIRMADMNGCSVNVLAATERVNAHQKTCLADKVKEYYGGNLNGKVFGVWGLAFKPNTSALDESPALEVIEELIRGGAQVKAYDPAAMENAKVYFKDEEAVELCEDQYDVMIDADALLVLTDWGEFKLFNYKVAELLLKHKLIFDGRNIFNPSDMSENGYEYFGIGRSEKKQKNR